MIRHAENSNLSLYYHPFYQGLPVQTKRGPLIKEYLERMRQVVAAALMQYARVFAFRCDLRFPVDQHSPYAQNNQVIERFIASFKAKIRHNRNKALGTNRYAHDTTVRYVWCREYGKKGNPHYHLIVLLNRDAFCALGRFEMGRNNLFNRLHEAWASALGLPLEDTKGLVELPTNAVYCLQLTEPNPLMDFFYRASYLCKAETKQYGDGVHGFGASRT